MNLSIREREKFLSRIFLLDILRKCDKIRGHMEMRGRGRVTVPLPYRELPFGARQPAAAANITSEQSAQHPAVQAPPAASVTGHSFEWPTLSAIRVVPQRNLLCLLTGQGFLFFLSIGEEAIIVAD